MNTEILQLLERLIKLVDSKQPDNDKLSYGRTSLVLLYFYYGHFFNNENYLNKGLALIQEIFKNIEEENDTFSGCDFYSGLTGLLSVLMNLNKYKLLDVDSNDFVEFEEMIFTWAISRLKDNDTDFFSGSSSVIFYFLNNLDSDSNEQKAKHVEYLKILLQELRNAFSYSDNLVYLKNEDYNSKNDIYKGTINYGLAHGMSSIILCLIHLNKKGLLDLDLSSLSKQILKSIIDVNKNHNPDFQEKYVNDFNVDNLTVRHQGHYGWCHSDFNLVHIFSLAKMEEHYKIQLGHLPDKIKAKSNEFDPFLCHGYAGIAQYCLKINSITEDNILTETYNEAIKEIILFYKDKENDYFFNSEFKAKGGHNHSFFYGNVGVALSLITSLKPQSKSWSEIIFI